MEIHLEISDKIIEHLPVEYIYEEGESLKDLSELEKDEQRKDRVKQIINRLFHNYVLKIIRKKIAKAEKAENKDLTLEEKIEKISDKVGEGR